MLIIEHWCSERKMNSLTAPALKDRRSQRRKSVIVYFIVVVTARIVECDASSLSW